MSLEPDSELCYRALQSHDRRFDGVFFVGVTSTGIYCRPVCTARVPKRVNCRFFLRAAAAEQAGFRPCLRCRPELAPGQRQAAVDAVDELAQAAAGRIEAGALAEGGSLQFLAEGLGVTPRHLRRVVQQRLGVSPVALAQTHRLLMAKRLLAETGLPMMEVALASGFRSLRRFNALFLERYGWPPTSLRKGIADSKGSDREVLLRLPYRPPYAWDWMLGYLRRRVIPGVEVVTEDMYARTVALGDRRGWLRVRQAAAEPALLLEVSAGLVPVLPVVLEKVRRLLDLDARPDVICGHLAMDEGLRPLVEAEPGLRVPGAFDGFETAVRTILGQQVTVAAATTLMARLCRVCAEPAETPVEGLARWPLRAEVMAGVGLGELGSLGIIRQRAASIIALAEQVAGGEVRLEPGWRTAATLERLQEIPGMGPWTANYLAMRVLGWPDAFLAADLGVRTALGRISPAAAERRSQVWRPWRSYAVVHLWHSLEKSKR